MVLTYDYLCDVPFKSVLTDLVKINVSKAGISYWRKGDIKHMFYVPFYLIDNVRIYDDEEYSRIRESKVM